MNKKLFVFSFALLSLTTVITSCSSDDPIENNQQQESTLTVNLQGKDIKSIEEMDIRFLEINTGKETTTTIQSLSQAFKLPKGSYKITVDGKVLLETGETMQAGANSSIDLTLDNHNIAIELFVKSFNADFIIEEVFFTGVTTLEGKAYVSGKYFKLTNNTDKVLSTGGLLICQSEFITTNNNHVTPEVKETDFSVKAILMLPHEYSKDIEPGDFIVIADMAANHQQPNIPAYDLSGADYEYPNLDNPALGDVDNPAVPNAKVIYSTLNFNMFLLHNRGSESYALARFPENISLESWLAGYTYTYEYTSATGKVTTKTAKTIPNAWIIDGINSAPVDAWEHNALGTSIDNGWTGVGVLSSDPDRFGKSVRRKVLGTMENGRNIYKDTNNSTEDFHRDAEPSLKNGINHS